MMMAWLFKILQKSKFMCAVGYHCWEWSLSDYPGRCVNGPPPDECKCIYCGVTYLVGEDE